MLVLTRKPGEALSIGDDVKVVVTAVNGNQVKIGVEAPRTMRILRTESQFNTTKLAVAGKV